MDKERFILTVYVDDEKLEVLDMLSDISGEGIEETASLILSFSIE